MNVWRLMAYHDDTYKSQVMQWTRENGVIAIGWGNTGDLNDRSFRNAEDLTKLVGRTHNISPSNHANGGSSLWRLVRLMQVGDLVIVKTSSDAVTMRVTGNYYFVSGEQPYYEHRRNAELTHIDPYWLWERSGSVAPGEGKRRTLIRCTRAMTDDELSAIG